VDYYELLYLILAAALWGKVLGASSVSLWGFVRENLQETMLLPVNFGGILQIFPKFFCRQDVLLQRIKTLQKNRGWSPEMKFFKLL
jgi:hypothetical protein